MENLILSSYKGSQTGVTVRNMNLDQLNFFEANVAPNGLAVDHANNVYLVAGNSIMKYTNEGRLLKQFSWQDNTIEYTCIAIKEDVVVVGYRGSQKGFSVRNLDLVQMTSTNIGKEISGIAVGMGEDVFVTCGNGIYQYAMNGIELNSSTWPDNSINYTCVCVHEGRVYAGYNGSQKGYTVRDMQLKQMAFHPVGRDISGISVSTPDDVFVTANNHIVHYDANGQVVKEFSWPDNTITYTGLFAFVGVMA